MSILVFADIQEGQLSPATANTVAAARLIGDRIDVVVAGHQVEAAVSAAAQLDGVARVLVADHEVYAYQLAEPVSKLLVSLSDAYTHVLGAASSIGKNVLPRLAALRDVAQVSDIIEVVASDTFKRPIYAGSAVATVQSTDAFKVITVRSSAFEAVGDCAEAHIERLETVIENTQSALVDQTLASSERPELGGARVVVSGGRGMGNADNFKLLEGIADKLGGAIGASRAAVDAGYVPNDMQVGQTGKIVAPELYVAVGISGAIQHMAGMKGSKVIVAINKDEDAPIFQVADYGLVADLFEALPELESKLEAR